MQSLVLCTEEKLPNEKRYVFQPNSSLEKYETARLSNSKTVYPDTMLTVKYADWYTDIQILLQP